MSDTKETRHYDLSDPQLQALLVEGIAEARKSFDPYPEHQ